MQNIGRIYIIRNKVNNKVYIGQTIHTLRELVDCIIKDEREWGGVAIGGWLDEQKIEYRYGKIIKNEFTEDELNSIVATVGAYGGWTNTDYWVSLK